MNKVNSDEMDLFEHFLPFSLCSKFDFSPFFVPLSINYTIHICHGAFLLLFCDVTKNKADGKAKYYYNRLWYMKI